mmetsp:Transcript_13540/g.27642  ORF Transcript_13540/g.27642 Transcript_13540/m.27642 type:complete len:91 (+) Transcript_13540:169-441(+)
MSVDRSGSKVLLRSLTQSIGARSNRKGRLYLLRWCCMNANSNSDRENPNGTITLSKPRSVTSAYHPIDTLQIHERLTRSKTGGRETLAVC